MPTSVNRKRTGFHLRFLGHLAAPALLEAAYNLSIHPA